MGGRMSGASPREKKEIEVSDGTNDIARRYQTRDVDVVVTAMAAGQASRQQFAECGPLWQHEVSEALT